MAAPETEHVRNVALVGQDGAGKTSLAEAMLFVSGRTSRMGTTHDGKSNLDVDPEEIKRRFTITTSLAPVHYHDYKINVLDTSGQPDFIGEALLSMQVCETALFVFDAVTGPQPMSTRLWKEANNMRLSRAVFINHIDCENADFNVAMATLHARFGSRLGAVNIPIGEGPAFKGVVDVLRMKARYFTDTDEELIEDIPPEYFDAAQAAREKLCDLVAEADEDLMMKYLDGEEQLTQDELEHLFDKAILQELFIPVFVGSTLIKQGIKGLIEDICTYFPSPTAHGRFRLANGETIRVSEEKRPCAYVFKTLLDPYAGRLSFLKVVAGCPEPGMELLNNRNSKKERLGRLYLMMGKETKEVKRAKAGDIIVVPKLAETITGDTLSQTGEVNIAMAPMPVPHYPIVIEADDKKNEDKLGTFLSRAAENDPTMIIDRNEETHQTVVRTMGDTMAALLLSRLASQVGIGVHTAAVRIPYRETIRKTAEAQGRHKKQTGGSGQFGDCWLRLEPNPGAGYEFVDDIHGGAIPNGLIPAVDKGVQETMAAGYLAGYPLVDIKCTCFDGSYHSVDSNEMAFRTAARIGFQAACAKADPVILEPIAEVSVTTPEEYAGAIMSDISVRRGRIIGTDSNDSGDTIIIARVPYANIITYTKDLRSLTRGCGAYTLEMKDYEQAPADVQAKLVEAYQVTRA